MMLAAWITTRILGGDRMTPVLVAILMMWVVMGIVIQTLTVAPKKYFR